MSASASATTTEQEEVNPAVVQPVCTTAEGESARSSCGESEILRNRLLCTKSFPGGGSNCVGLAGNLLVNCNSALLTMSSTSGGSEVKAPYPKCNISLSMSGSSEQLTVITTPLNNSGAPGGIGGGDVMSGESGGQSSAKIVPLPLLVQPKVEKGVEGEMEKKPVVTDVNQCRQNVPVPPPPLGIPPQDIVKTEPAVVKIPYDRERILNFLTDYWKSKNLQQVTEAQQQTAGVSGVNSADFCPAPQRIVEEALFDLFVEHPMIIDGLAITKRSWAKAFYEKDVIQTSKVLFEALFSEMEMQQCTLNGKKGTPELSAIKMLAILRAAAWMKNKKQDPYSFNTNIPSHNQFPTNEEREKIEKKVFTERRSQANRKITKTGGNGDGGGCGSSPHTSAASENQVQECPLPPKLAAPAGENRLTLSDDVMKEHRAPLAKIPRLDLDTEVIKQLQMLYAENPEGLISYLLPEARAILIDGFLIPYDDWRKAFDEASTDFVKSAWTLFKVLFSKTEILNCTLNGKNGTKELCPVKKLAILRAVTWMKENQGAPIDILSFNVRRTECNCFPSDEDKDKIETKVYTEKRYQACRKLKGQQL